ncbi:MAG TPA: RNA polymerase subunit sigma-70 [Candidatus Limnocylindrales bacterium]
MTERRLPASDQEFGELIEGHRKDIVLLCYRFLGSLDEAEEAAQETALRAWRASGSFRGQAAVRTWLHRIATRACLDQIRKTARRPVALPLGSASDPREPPASPSAEAGWIQPLPDRYLVDVTDDPAARYSLRESVSLAFLAAIQSLPARQRAVLILRDVVGWSAAEVAPTLDMSVAGVNSALHRARAVLRERHHGAGIEGMRSEALGDPGVRTLVDAYAQAWDAADVDGLVAVLKADVRLAMPPSPSWYHGAAAVAGFIDRWIFKAVPPGHFRFAVSEANGQPAMVLLERRHDGRWTGAGIQVLTVESGAIAAIDAFMDAAAVRRFEPTDHLLVDRGAARRL